MEEEIMNLPELPAEVQVVDIQFRPGQKIYYLILPASTAKPATM